MEKHTTSIRKASEKHNTSVGKSIRKASEKPWKAQEKLQKSIGQTSGKKHQKSIGKA